MARVNLNNANLSNTDMHQSVLHRADMKRVKLSRGDMSDSDLRKVDFTGADLSGTNFSNSDMNNVILSECNGIVTSFTNCNMEGSVIVKSDFRGADFSQTNLKNARLEKTNFRGSNLSYADISVSHINNVNLSGADLRKTRFIESILRENKLYGANLIEADFSSANLSSSDLQAARMNYVNIDQAILDHTNITGSFILNMRGKAKSAIGIYCQYLEFGREEGKEVIDFDENQIRELIQHLTNEGLDMQSLYEKRNRADRNPLVKIKEFCVGKDVFFIEKREKKNLFFVSYRGLNKETNEKVEIIIFSPDFSILETKEKEKIIFEELVENLQPSQIQHPNLVKIIKYGIWRKRTIYINERNAQRPFFISEYLDSLTIKQLREQREIPTKEARKLMVKIIQGVYDIFSQIDSKQSFLLHPGNIYITENTNIKISSFIMDYRNIMKIIDEGSFPESFAFIKSYISPEQRKGKEVNFKSYVFSLGMIFHYILTQKILKRNWSEKTKRLTSRLRKSDFNDVNVLITKMTREINEKRPSFEELIAALEDE